MGHVCEDDAQAKSDGSVIARRLGNEHPGFLGKTSSIRVTNENEDEIAQFPLAPDL
jgi:hypothetical protein